MRPLRASLLALAAVAACVPADQDYDNPDAARAFGQIDLACADVSVAEASACGDEQCWDVSGCSQTAEYSCPDSACTRVEYTGASSTVAIDEVPFIPDGANLCRSGIAERLAFYGVDLSSPSGAGLRIVQNPDLTFELIATSPAGDHSPALAGCATVELMTNDDTSLTGQATIACAAGAWTVKGDISFETCR